MDANLPALPSWVRHRDGRTEPFDADRINRSLFAATERLGTPDAFLARELTDGVLHFLAQETDEGVITAEQIDETLVKVVRELGQPQLARSYAERPRPQPQAPVAEPAMSTAPGTGPALDHIRGWLQSATGPAELARRCAAPALETYCLEHVFTKNLIAAHREGLLRLENLDLPVEMAAAVIKVVPETSRSGGASVLELVEQARAHVGGVLALDAPERLLAQRGSRIGDAAVLVRELGWAARSLGLQVVLNLGSETAPDWAEDLAEGPLFANHRHAEDTERVRAHLDALLDLLLVQEELHLSWHLAERDFEEPEGRRRLARLVRRALSGAPVTFAIDRPRHPAVLGPGLDRSHSAVVQWVGLGLPALLQRLRAASEPEAFANKVMSLARLAVSGGVQKREFVRRHGRPDRPPFLLDRGHVAIHLLGLPETLAALFGPDPWARSETPAFVLQLFRRLQETLDHEARHVHLSGLLCETGGPTGTPLAAVSGKARLRTLGRLHNVLGRGTAFVSHQKGDSPDPAEWIELLHHVWKQTAICQVRFIAALDDGKQLTAPWHE